MAVVAVLSIISYMYLRSVLERDARDTLDRQVSRIGLHAAQNLIVIQDSLSGLANNTLVINSLNDPEGRKRYLKPFFRTYVLPGGTPFHIRLYDRRNILLASNFPAVGLEHSLDAGLRDQVLKAGMPSASLQRNGTLWTLRLAYPVTSPATSYTDGALVLEVLLEEVFRRAVGRSAEHAAVSITSAGETLMSTNSIARPGRLSLSRELPPLLPPLDGLRFTVHVNIPADFPAVPLRRLTVIYLTIGAAVLIVTLLISRVLARRMTAPLLDLHDTAEAITHGLRPVLPIPSQGDDEVASLASSFNSMLVRLHEATDLLELRVRERTAELAREKTFTDTVVDSMPGVFFAVDPDGTIIKRNRDLELFMAGRTGSISLPALVLPDEQQRVQALLRETMDRGTAAAEVTLQDADGRVAPFFVSCTRFPAGDATLIIGTGIDIAGLKTAETRLRASEEKFKALIESTSDWIWEIDANGVYTYASPKLKDILGYAPEEVLGKTPFDLMAPAEAARLRTLAADTMQARRPFRRLENLNRHKDGHAVILETSAVPFFDKDGHWLGYRGIDRDITDRRMVEDELAELNRTLQQQIADEVAKSREKDRIMMVQSRQAALGEMLGNVAHQWRQPLNTLGLIVQDIEHAGQAGDLTAEYLQRSVARAMDIIQHLSQTIDDFRGFFRPGAEQRPFIVNHVVQRVLSFVRDSFQTAGIDLRVNMDDDVTATGHANEFAQVLLNILNNAREVLRARSVASPRVDILLSRVNGRANVTIADNGGGIPAADLDRVFEPYFTTKEGVGGTGIGLYMSKTIIERNMGGSLTVRNSGEGAEFLIQV